MSDLSAVQQAAPQVTRRCIRNTGREFEEAFSCPADPARAELAAYAFARSISYVCNPSVRKIGAAEWSCRWWGLD